MKKVLALISICCMLVLVGCGNKVETETAEKYYNHAESIVNYLNEKKYDEIIESFDENMKAQLTAEQLAQIEPIIEDSGEFEKISKKSIEEKDGIMITILVADYSKDKRIFTISYDKNEKISGLYVK